MALAMVALFAGAAGAATHTIALFPSASSPQWEGFARIANHSDEAGAVRITGIDAAGSEHGPVALTLAARATAHLNSGDLEAGNAGKGLSGGLGDGEGDWRLRLESELDIEALSYIRTEDGFVTAMHEVVPGQGGRYHVRFFNPGGNASQVSRLRLVNPSEAEVEVTIEGRDDAGAEAPGGAVTLTLGPGEAREVSAQALESGGDGLTGSLGDGTGKWQLFVEADGATEVMSLLRSPTGHLANLSAPGLRDGGGVQELSLFMPASDAVREGFARILNYSEDAGTVRIYGIDDTGEWRGPVTLSLEAGAAAHVNSGDLEAGNTSKGLEGAFGAGTGSWRLELHSELDIESLAYVRTADGFVTTMHERVRESARRHRVPFFNPGSNASQVSRVRLINPTEAEVAVTIAGRDDAGAEAPGGEVTLTLGPGEAREVTAQALETGGDGLAGSLGDGTGKWQLFVAADGAIEVMSLLQSPTGHLANLSVAGVAGVVSEDGVDAPVNLDVVVTLPAEVTSLQAGDLTTTVLGTPGGAVVPGGARSLMVARDAHGAAVLYAFVDEHGGLLGEGRGTVRVSVASTAVVLVALAAGYRIPSVTPEAVEAILSHAEFGVLVRTVARLMGADTGYLGRLSDYPDVVALMQRMAESLHGGDAAAALARAQGKAAPVAQSVLPEGTVKTDFYCTPLTRSPCSAWEAHAPWRWFGEARGAETYRPEGMGWAEFFRRAASGGVFAEGYEDFLEEAARAPFLARSEARSEVHAAASPGFAGYAMELYAGTQLRGWRYVPGNATTVAKLASSGAAYRELIAGDDLSADIDRIRFERYRLGDGGETSDRAAVVGFVNTAQMLLAVAGVVSDASAMERLLIALADDADTVPCARAFAQVPVDKSDPTATDIERALALFRTSAEALFRTLTTTPACGTLLVRYRDAALAGLVDEGRIGALVDAVRLAAVIDPLFGAANETVPSAVSYFAPQAARSEYHVQWARTEGGQASIERVSEAPLPVAAFTYAQQRGHRVELDASGSEGEGLGYAWAVDGAGIGTGQTLEHDFAGAGRFDVTLTVTDRGGVTAEEQGSVTVTTGRAPEVRSLTCTPTGEGQAFTMQAGIADADEDIVSVEWFSAIANTRPDQTTGADEDSVTLSAPAGASYTRAKVRVVDAGGNAAQGSCPVELDPGAPVPRVAGASAEEDEALAFTLSLDSAPAEAVTYYYATYRGSAHTGDYTAHAGTALELAPGERSATITVQTTEDARIERNETLYLYIAESASDLAESPPSRYLARAAGTIRDDDETAEPAASVRIADAQAEEGEALAFTVTLDPAPAAAVTYYYATYRGTADRDDYTGRLATALRFASGERTKTITVRTTEDADDEDDETFFVYVTESTGELTASAPARYLARATGTIRDDDGEVTETCTGSTVHIPDAALHRAVEASLGKAHGARITPAEMRRLRSLYAQHKGIESLAGLQCATGLTFLYLYANQLTDVSPLSGLTALWGLFLSNNQLTDVSPLSGLTALRVLYLYDNQLTEVSLSGLTALTELYLYDNQLTEVSLSGLTALRVLDLNDNQISDVSPLSGLTALRGLHLDYNQISDVSPLSGLTALRVLDLNDNQISDVSPLSGLTALWGLWLNDNQLTDVSPLSGLTALRGLYLDYNQISDIGPLVANAGLGRGDRVSLSRNPLSTQSRDVYIPALRARGAYVIY